MRFLDYYQPDVPTPTKSPAPAILPEPLERSRPHLCHWQWSGQFPEAAIPVHGVSKAVASVFEAPNNRHSALTKGAAPPRGQEADSFACRPYVPNAAVDIVEGRIVVLISPGGCPVGYENYPEAAGISISGRGLTADVSHRSGD